MEDTKGPYEFRFRYCHEAFQVLSFVGYFKYFSVSLFLSMKLNTLSYFIFFRKEYLIFMDNMYYISNDDHS